MKDDQVKLIELLKDLIKINSIIATERKVTQNMETNIPSLHHSITPILHHSNTPSLRDKL